MLPPQPPMTGTVIHPYTDHYMEANRGERFVQHVPQSFILIMNLVNAITQFLLGGVVIAALMMAYVQIFTIEIPWPIWPPSVFYKSFLTEHIILCVLGYMVLMSQAILTFNPHAGWADTLLHPQKKNIHLIMQVMGSILAICGSLMKFFDHQRNFQSGHGILGLVAMMLTVISLISGALNLILPTQTKTKLYNTCHGCLGSLTITIAFISLSLAFHSSLYRSSFGTTNASLAISVTVGALLGILAASCTRIVRRLNGV